MPSASIDPNTTLRRLLLAMPEHRPVLECLGINATGDGDRTLAELCELRGLEARTVGRMLAAMREAGQQVPAACLELMTLPELCDHLKHAHRNLHDELMGLDRLTETLAREHGGEHPRLLAIRKCFVAFHRRFKAHLRKEAEQLFAACRRWSANRSQTGQTRLSFKSSLARSQREHAQAVEALDDLWSLAVGDVSSASARAAAQTIADAVVCLENSVHEQIYKENHVLFPKALARHLQNDRIKPGK